MTKIIKIDGREVEFKSTGAFLLRYKAQFGRDALKDVYKLQDALDKDGNLENIDMVDLEIFYNMAFTLAKVADKSIPNDPMDWLDTFSEFPLMDIMPSLIDMMILSFAATQKK